MTRENELIYVWDAYCGWCYGFSATIQKLHENHPELPFTIWNGGLFVGNRSHSIGAFPHIPEANQRISQLTGVTFGEAYEQLVQEGHFIMDSESAAIGLYALRSLAPDRVLSLASAIQHAFYYEGKSLSDLKTYHDIVLEHNMNTDVLLAMWQDPATKAAVHEEFAQVRHLGVNGYPSLLLRKGAEFISLGGMMGIEELEQRLMQTNITQHDAGAYCAVDERGGC